MRLGAAVGLFVLLVTVVACTPPSPPFLAATGEVAATPIALTGDVARSSVSSTGSVPGSADTNYSLQAVDFDRARFGSDADCFTAAAARRLPLDICRGGL